MAFFSRNQFEILSLLFAHPKEEFYLSKIGEILGKRPGVFQRGINALETDGIIKSKKLGNQRLFFLNTDCVFFNEIRSIVNKTYGAEELLRTLFASLKQVKTALVFGSYAKNRLHADSDIDLLIVTTKSKIEDTLLEKLSGIERKIQREINYKIYVFKEFENKRALKDPFLEEILNDKYILLKGSL